MRGTIIIITTIMMLISWNLHSIYSVFLFYSFLFIWFGVVCPGQQWDTEQASERVSKEWKTEMKIEEPKKHNRVIKKYKRQRQQRRWRRRQKKSEKNYFWSSNGLSDAASNGSGWSSSGNDGASIDNTADICDATAAHSSSKFYVCNVRGEGEGESGGPEGVGWWKLKIYI